jgi:hypothetical protein
VIESDEHPIADAVHDTVLRIENFQAFHYTADAIVGEFQKDPNLPEGYAVVHLEIPRSFLKAIAWKQEICEYRSSLSVYYR